MKYFYFLVAFLMVISASPVKVNACSCDINISSNTAAICMGTVITFTGTTTGLSGMTTYQWLKNGVAMTGTGNNGTIPSPGNSTFHFITDGFSNGDVVTCYITEPSGSFSVTSTGITITVNALPAISAGSNVAICTGSTVTLNATGGVSYTWVPTSALSCTACASPSDNPTVTTTYSVTGTGSNGCKNTAVVTVTVNSLPAISAGTNTSVCIGSSVTLHATGGVSYIWVPASALSCTACASPSDNPTVMTTYTVTGTDANGCMNTTTVTVSVNPLPTINVGPADTSICDGAAITLTATGGVSYTWTPTSGLSCTACASPSDNPMTTTTYTVTGTDANGCMNTAMITVSINPLPIISAGSGISICVGNSVTLDASGGVSYTWEPTSGLSCTACESPSDSPTVTTTYTVTGTDTNGCTNTDMITITVDPLPTVSAGPASSICNGGTVTFAPSGGISYFWAPVSGPSCSAANPVINPSVTTTYTVIGTDTNGCTNSSTVVITVNQLPTISAGTNTSICIGGSLTLNATGGASYIWVPTSALSCTACANPTGNPTLTTTYTVTGTDTNGCMNTANITITVNLLPTISAGSNVAICTGSAVILNATGGVSYTWIPTYALSCTACASPSDNPTITTTYTVTGTDANGCENTASVTVVVNSLPTISAGSNTSVCSGNSTTLNATGGVSYTWLPTSGLSCTVCSNPSDNPAITTTYTVTGTDANGCTNTATVTVSVNPLPTISAGPGTSICDGATITLNATGGVSYTWVPASGLSCTACASPLDNPITTTTYTVTGTDANGCVNSAMITVSINPLPIISAGSGATICVGNSVILNASGGISYSWEPTSGLSCTACESPSGSPTATTTYTVTGTDANGCVNTAGVTVTVNTLPTIIAGPNSTICIGGSVTIDASGGVSYTWLPASTLSCTACASPTGTPATTTTYTVTGTDANGCMNTATVVASVNPLPTISAGTNTSICLSGSLTLNATGGVSYIWIPTSALSCTACSNPTGTPTLTTTYTVTGTDANGCMNTATVTVTVNALPTISGGSGVAICNGSSVVLNASGGISYIWVPASTLSCASCANPTGSPNTTTTYTVTGTDVNGCVNTSNVTLSVNPLPTIIAGPNSTICAGGSLTLNASGGVSYTWLPASTLSCTDCASPAGTPATTTTYTVTGTDANSCMNTATVTVSVNPLPTISAGASTGICTGGSLTLNATGGVSYTWIPTSTLSCTACANPTGNPTVTTTYTVIGTDANGCMNTANVTITVNLLPTISAGTNTSICVGGSLTLNATGGVSYTWAPAPSLSCTACANPADNPTTTTTYTVTGTDANGCANIAYAIITVNSLPTISAGLNTSICSGNSATLSATGGVSYTWTPASGLSCTACSGPSDTPIITTTYTVTGTDANGCENTAVVTISVNASPVTNYIVNDSSQTLTGNSFTFTSTGSTGPGYTYLWNFGDGSTSTTINPTHSYTAAGTYTVTETTTSIATGCSTTYSGATSYPEGIMVLSANVGGGGGGGLESENLAGLVAFMDFNNFKNSVNTHANYKNIPILNKLDPNARGNASRTMGASDRLSTFVPASLNNETTPYITSPTNIVTITTAVDVFSIDYVEEDMAKAVVLAITTLNKAYNHTKSICDRFKGATLMGTKLVTIQGFNFIQFELLQSNGNIEYCIAFDAGKSDTSSSFDLQSKWLITEYHGDDSVFNFQAWAADPANTQALVNKILTNLSAIMPLKQIDTAFQLPPAYISSGVRNKGVLNITMTNNTTVTNGQLAFQELKNELSDPDSVVAPLTLSGGPDNKAGLQINDGYQYQGGLFLDGKLVDEVYMADGNWSLDYDHSLTQIDLYEPTNEPNRVYADSEYNVYRGVAIQAKSADYISAYKFIAPGDEPVDLSNYQSLKFFAQGSGQVIIRLLKDSIVNWNDQYYTTLTLDTAAAGKLYDISLSDFASDTYSWNLNPSDVEAVVFTFLFNGVNTNFNFYTGQISFSPDAVPNSKVLELKTMSVSPNPNNGNFDCKFESDANRMVEISVSDITGKIVYKQNTLVTSGSNTVPVSLPGDIMRSSTLIVSVGYGNVQYTPVKIIIQ